MLCDNELCMTVVQHEKEVGLVVGVVVGRRTHKEVNLTIQVTVFNYVSIDFELYFKFLAK